MLSDAGIVGAALGIIFVVALFRLGFARRESRDKFRRGVATGASPDALPYWCTASSIHTPNARKRAALLVLAALATINGRVEQVESTTISGKRRRRRRSSKTTTTTASTNLEPAETTALSSG
ncbi:MAG: hypothetical protein WKF84_04870 [Pyrinomonadaceae bacterium]